MQLHFGHPIVSAFFTAVLVTASPLWAGPPTREAFPELKASMSWFGNSFSGKEHWMPNGISDIAVAADGTVYANTFWDEACNEAGIYRDGRMIGMAGHTHGWGYNGGYAVAVSSNYLFLSQVVDNEGGKLKDETTWPAVKGVCWVGVSRRKLDGSAAPFPGGKGGAGDTLKGCFLNLHELPLKDHYAIKGLACVNGRLYITDAHSNRVCVIDQETMTPVAEWPCDRPGRIAAASDGTLWVLQLTGDGKTARIAHVDGNGKALAEQLDFPNVPRAFALDPKGRLLVAEGLPSLQVRIWEFQDGKAVAVGAIGREGGILAAPAGKIEPDKLFSVSGLGCDAEGNLYLAGSGPTTLRSLTPDGQSRWFLYANQFVDCAAIDPASDGAELYSSGHRFTHVPGRPPGQDWEWRGFTIDALRFPHDPRLAHISLHPWASVTLRRIGKELFMYVWGMHHEYMAIFRKEADSEIFIPCGLLQATLANYDWPPQAPKTEKDKPHWIWVDRNGDGQMQSEEFETLPYKQRGDKHPWGWFVDSRGDIWRTDGNAGLRHLPLAEVAANGVPLYRAADERELSLPRQFTELTRVEYFPERDEMYLAGYTFDHTRRAEEWGMVGTEVIRYADWSKPERRIATRFVLPYNPKVWPDKIKSICVLPEADLLIAGQMSSLELFLYDLNTGDPVGRLDYDRELFGPLGWLDIPNGIRAFRKSDGEIVVTAEDVWKAKGLVYRFRR